MAETPILPHELPAVPSGIVIPTAAIIVDDESGVYKATPAEVVRAALPRATEAEILSAANVDAYLNPSGGKQLVEAYAPVTSVNGQTGGAVVITKTDVGLGDVENLAPADYPVSTDQAAAIATAVTDFSDDLATTVGASMIGAAAGGTVQDWIDTYVVNPFTIPCYVNPPLDNDEMLFTYVFAQDIFFPPDFDGSSGVAITLPAAATTLTILKLPVGEDIANAVPAGEVVYNTDGSFVFTTVGNAPLSFATGEAIITQGQATADATAAYSLTLIGAR